MSATPATSSAATAASPCFADLPAAGNGSRGPLRLEYRWINSEVQRAPNGEPGGGPNCEPSRARGDAPLAVFLHEGLGSVDMWRDWPQTLCDVLGMRGLVYSRPGYGRSTPRPHAERWAPGFMSHQAENVLPALLDALGIGHDERRRMWVIGHSDGGSIALLYAAAYPDALAGAVAIAPHVFVEDVSVASIAETKTAYEQGELRPRLARYHADVDSAFYGWNDIWLDPAFRSWSIVDRLARIRVPLLAIQGHDDHYGTMAQIDTIADEVPHAQLAKLDDCGHSPHRDAPDELNDAIARFVANIAATKRA